MSLLPTFVVTLMLFTCCCAHIYNEEDVKLLKVTNRSIGKRLIIHFKRSKLAQIYKKYVFQIYVHKVINK